MLRFTLFFLGLFSLFTGLTIAQAQSEPSVVKVGLSEIRIIASNSFMQLRYRQEAVAEGQAIKLISRLQQEDFEAALFEIQPGNGQCRGGVVGITARKGEEARFDRRLIDVCAGFEVVNQKDTLLLIEKPRVTGAGSLWRFTAREGLKIIGALEFTPEPGTGFESLKPENYRTNQDLLTNQAVFKGIYILAGANAKSYMQALIGYAPKSLVFNLEKRFIQTSGCIKESHCTTVSAFMFIDTKSSNLYLGHKSSSTKPVMYPDSSRWSLEAKQQFTLWADTLK